MCGRYSLKDLPAHLRDIYQITGRLPDFLEPRYNIAPKQFAPVIGFNRKTGKRSMVEMRWGLVPAGAKDDSFCTKLINARAETVASLDSFKTSFRHRRCIVPAAGFYEWKREQGGKQPYYFQVGDMPMGLAGIWADWHQGDSVLRTYSIITTAANQTVSALHDRMPVILPPHHYDAWLDPDQPVASLQDMLVPYGGAMHLHTVSKEVNKIGSEGAQLCEPFTLNSK